MPEPAVKISVIQRITRSIRDGTFFFKLLNRIFSVHYVPSPQAEIDRFFFSHYKGKNYGSVSQKAREVWINLFPVFNEHEIQTIAYAGSFNGDIALAIDKVFPDREFYLFEPVPVTYRSLLKNVANNQNMHCFNIALGSRELWCDMFVDSFTPASSLLHYEPIALREFPFLGKQQTVQVQVRPLDHIVKEMKLNNIDLLYMDVQGYEDMVLKGAKEVLKTCKVVVTELSLQSLYLESSLFDSTYQFLISEGFHLRYLMNPIIGMSHQTLQIDGIFVRK